MSLYAYLGGCVIISGGCYLAAKVYSYRNGSAQAVEGNNINSAKDDNLGEALRTANAKELSEKLEIELNKTKARLAELQNKYQNKYDVNLKELAAAKDTTVKSSNLKKRGGKTRSRESGGSSESAAKAATIIPKSNPRQTSIAETFTVEGASSKYTDARKSPTCSGFSEEEESEQKNPLVGKAEVEPNEKVEKWLKTNTGRATNLTPDHPVRNENHDVMQKPVAMTISPWDPPKSKKSIDKDCVDDCETYVSSAKRVSPKKNAPHLYKRLNLRKKSTVTLEDSNLSKSKSRKSVMDNIDMPRKSKEKSKKSEVLKKSFQSEPDLRSKKHDVNKDAVETASNKSSADLRTKYDDDGEASINYTNDNYGGSDSDHFLEPSHKSSGECASITANSKNINEEHRAVSQRNKCSLPSLEKCPPNSAAIPKTAVETAARHSSRPKLKQSHSRLKNKLDEVLAMKSKSFDTRKSSPSRKKMVESLVVNRTDLAETKQSSSQNQADYDSDGEVIWATKSKSAGSKGERKVIAQLPSSNQEGSQSEGHDSGEEDCGIKSQLCDKKKAFAAKHIMKLIGASQKPTKGGTETMKLRASLAGKKTGGEDNISGKRSDSNERPTSVNDVLPTKIKNEKSKEFLGKHRLQARPKSADREVNPFHKRKEFQAKYHMKEMSGMDGPDVSEKVNLSAKTNQFGKRKEFEAKYHIKVTSADQERLKSADNEDLCMKPDSQKRKEILVQFQKKPILVQERPMFLKNEVKLEVKGKELGNLTTTKIRSKTLKDVVSGKTRNVSPLKRRMEYDAKCRKSFANLHKTNSVANEETSKLEKKKDRNAEVQMNDMGSKLDRLTISSTIDESGLMNLTKGSPTMNRQPNDGTRKAYLFDWESKRYAVAADIATSGSRGGQLIKPRRSSIPPSKGKILPPPKGFRRHASAGSKRDATKTSSAFSRAKDSSSNRTKCGIDSDDENLRVVGRCLGRKSSTNLELSSGSKSSLNSLDLEFNVKDLNDLNFSSPANSVLSEEIMIKELEGCLHSENESDEEAENETVDAMVGEFVFPKCPSDFLPNESGTRPKLQNILDLPMNCSGTTINDNLLSRSETKFGSDGEDTPSDHVFTGTKALKKVNKASSFRKESSEVLTVLTDGFIKLAIDDTY